MQEYAWVESNAKITQMILRQIEMFDFSNLQLLLKMNLEDWLIFFLGILGGGILASLVIAFYTQTKWKSIFKNAFSSKIFLSSVAVCFLIFLFVIWLYGLGEYAIFMACVLGLFYVMAYIDSLLLAIPDFLNFLCLFFIFSGLFYFGLLSEEHFIATFSSAGALGLLKIFGSFIFKKEILGEADIVIFASMSGLVLLDASLYLMIISCLLAMGYILILGLFSLKERQISLFKIKIPFAVFLSLGFVIMLVYLKFGEIIRV